MTWFNRTGKKVTFNATKENMIENSVEETYSAGTVRLYKTAEDLIEYYIWKRTERRKETAGKQRKIQNYKDLI